MVEVIGCLNFNKTPTKVYVTKIPYTLALAAPFFTWNVACILPAAYTRDIPRGTKFSISNSLDGTEDDILWTDVRDGTHDTVEDDTYGDLPYL